MHQALLPGWGLLHKAQRPLPPHLDLSGVLPYALSCSHHYSQPSSIYLYFSCTVFINKVLACNWSHNPHYSTESQHFKESLLLHQSDPQLKASNLPMHQLNKLRISCFYCSSIGNLFLCKNLLTHCFLPPAGFYSANSLFWCIQLTEGWFKPTPRQKWQSLAFGRAVLEQWLI